MQASVDWNSEQDLINTLALPSRARRVLTARNADDVLEGVALARREGLSVLPLGQGSNVVLPERLEQAVFVSNDVSIQVLDERRGSVSIRVGAGVGWHALVTQSVANGWFGLENLALIPGTVGAAPVQNIGAYGVELSAFVSAVHGVDLEDVVKRSLTINECEFAYRDSVFKNALRDRFMITAVDFVLLRQAQVNLSYPVLANRFTGDACVSPQAVCDAVVEIRQSRLPDPAVAPNAGSFFKNPVVDAPAYEALRAAYPALPGFLQPDGSYKLPAAWLIETAGLRGFTMGTAGMAEQHALVLVNLGGAVQGDVLALAEFVKEQVSSRFKVALEIEPRVYG
ncbi:MAG: UDP-N-acetylmuramate dehydrogenase [Congregibacter sp.]